MRIVECGWLSNPTTTHAGGGRPYWDVRARGRASTSLNLATTNRA